MSIILAAMAPVVTTKMRADKNSSLSSDVWHWTTDDPTRAYLGSGGDEVAMIGQKENKNSDNAKLIIKASNNLPNHIGFKYEDNESDTDAFTGVLQVANKSILLGSGSVGNRYAIAIGDEAKAEKKFSVSIGNGAGTYNHPQFDDIAIGADALGIEENLDGETEGLADANIAIGASSLLASSGRSNLAIGEGALRENSGDTNIAIGSYTLGNPDIGNYNIAIGASALEFGKIKNDNIAIGRNACHNMSSNAENVICIGAETGPGSSVSGSDTNAIYIGNSSITDTYIAGTLLNTSDKRLKNVKSENKSGLDKIKQLKVFDYTFKKDATKTPHVGVIAQDLQKVFPDAVKKGGNGFLVIRQEDMFYAVINAIKELDAKWQAHDKRLQQLEKENKELKVRLEKLEAKLK